MGRVAAVVLAAGEASRFGSPKQRLLLPRVLERLAETSVDEVVVVEGAHELEPDDTIRLVRCPAWMQGPGASLRCGLAALDDEVEAVVVVLADGPNLNPATVERVLDELARTGRDRRSGVRRRARTPTRPRPRRLGGHPGRGSPRPPGAARPVR